MNPIASSFINPARVTIDGDKLEARYATVRKLYLADERPWVIGYSGGKDSTAVLQLVWHALRGLEPDERSKPVYVISSDTLVETPAIVEHVEGTLDRINKAAVDQDMPFTAHKVVPEVDDTFWVNLLGRGYPAPYTGFRWCTDRMKIKPATKFIYDKIGKLGEVVVLLGARVDESISRGERMKPMSEQDKAKLIELEEYKKREDKLSKEEQEKLESLIKKKQRKLKVIDEHYTRHRDIVGAWVYTPIRDWQVEDVWTYLLNAPSPWGNRNRDLVTMYRNAQAGECPLVIDTSTPSCGNSRFGCWTCTVVEKDKAMEAMVDAGEDWMEPMLEFRNLLASTQDPAKKHEIRDYRRRNGRIQFTKTTRDGAAEERKIAHGPYLLSYRKDLLIKLLEAQQQARQRSGDDSIKLITEAELKRIRQIWRLDEGDWEDSVPKIYAEVVGGEIDWLEDDWSGMGAVEKQILEEVAKEHELMPQMLAELFDAEREQHGMSRRSRIYNRIGSVLSKDWRTRDQVVALPVIQVDASEDIKTGKE